jgi:hypothetical protein
MNIGQKVQSCGGTFVLDWRESCGGYRMYFNPGLETKLLYMYTPQYHYNHILATEWERKHTVGGRWKPLVTFGTYIWEH